MLRSRGLKNLLGIARGFRSSFVSRNQTPSNVVTTETSVDKLKSKLFEFMSVYEEAIGIKEIKQAQQAVLDVCRKKFVDAQNDRRALNLELIDIQQKLRSLRDEMDRLSRTDSRFLKLFTEEHNLLQTESKLVTDYKLKESQERDLFFYLSAALRDAQEKERVRIERIKYLQLSLSILCSVLGILGAYLLNYFRNANIREILVYDKEQFQNVKELINQINEKQKNVQIDLSKKLDGFQEQNVKNQNLLIESLEDILSSAQIVQEEPEVKPNEHLIQVDETVQKQEQIKESFKDEYVQIHPYLLSAMFLLGFIIYTNK